MAKLQKWQNNNAIFTIIAKTAKNVCHFRHHGENGEKIDGENGEFFRNFAMAKIKKNNNKWRMAMSPPNFFWSNLTIFLVFPDQYSWLINIWGNFGKLGCTLLEIYFSGH